MSVRIYPQDEISETKVQFGQIIIRQDKYASDEKMSGIKETLYKPRMETVIPCNEDYSLQSQWKRTGHKLAGGRGEGGI